MVYRSCDIGPVVGVGAVSGKKFKQVRTRTSSRGRHRHLLLRNIVGPVTRLHLGQLRDCVKGSDDGSATTAMKTRMWRWVVEGCFLGTRSRYHVIG
jgi:hypothetical protein